jgi:choline-sulfatase
MKKNILLIMSDQHNKKLLGCYGNEIVRTPNLDRLAAEGMTFTDAYCAAPLCVPSRMSFMTGRQPSSNKVWTNSGQLSSEIPCWTHQLSLSGHETTLIGRMHFNGPDQWHGFQQRPVGEIGFPIESWGIDKLGCSQERSAPLVAGKGTSPYKWYDDRITEATCEYLRTKAADKSQPFAAVTGFLLPHNPYIGPAELFDYYYDKIDLPEVDEFVEPPDVAIYKAVHGFAEPLDPEQIRRARAAYFALCEYTDTRIGHILDCLEATGLAENTVVIYVSDHGDMAGEKGCWTKSCYYDGSAGVPMVIRAPGITEPGSSSSSVVNLYDLPPTLCDLAGAEPMPYIDGHSLVPLLHGDDSAWNNETYSELCNTTAGNCIVSRMIRSDDWKLWYDATNKVAPALFNLKIDPEELNNLAATPESQAKVDELMQKLMTGWEPEMITEAVHQEALLSSRAHVVFGAENPDLGNSWQNTITAWWNSMEISFKDWAAMKHPHFPAELDSPYQPPVGR